MIENPGFFIEINNHYTPDDGRNLRKIVNKLPPEYGSKIVEHNNDVWSWMFFEPTQNHKLISYSFYDDGDFLVLFVGSLYNKEFAGNNSLLGTELLKLTEDLQEDKLSEFLNKLSGYFCGILFNKQKNKLYGFTDKFGLTKLFYTQQKNSLLISTNLYLIREYFGNDAQISKLAESSIVFCGHTFSDQSLLEGVKQVQPGSYIDFRENFKPFVNKEYIKYPKRLNLTLDESVEMVSNAHQKFLANIKDHVKNNLTVFLSGGKDARVILKHTLDEEINPKVLTFYREGNPLSPFVTFLLDSKDDAETAKLICENNNIEYDRVRVDNITMLENMIDILLLNNGTPMHWEFFKASQYAAEKTDYITLGLGGELLSGKLLDFYKIFPFKNLRSSSKYKFDEFNSDIYENFRKQLNNNSICDLLPYETLFEEWYTQHKLINSDDLLMKGAMGIFRTRGIGRMNQTQHQVRSSVIPIYPYLDYNIMNAYMSLPIKHLKSQVVHLRQISTDRRFNNYPTTRAPINAINENRYRKILALARKIETEFNDHKKEPLLSSEKVELYRKVLEKTLQEEIGYDEELVKRILPENTPYKLSYFKCVVNLINLNRIKRTYLYEQIPVRFDLTISNYKEVVKEYSIAK